MSGINSSTQKSTTSTQTSFCDPMQENSTSAVSSVSSHMLPLPEMDLGAQLLSQPDENEPTSEDKEEDNTASGLTNLGENSLKRSEIDELTKWLQDQLKGKAYTVTATTRLENFPCAIIVEEMAAIRHFIKSQSHQISEDRLYALLQAQLEINPTHPIIQKLDTLRTTDPELADLLAKQLFATAMIGAGLVGDPTTLFTSINDLLTRVLEKH